MIKEDEMKGLAGKVRERMFGELVELEKLVAEAPDDSPVKIALSKIRDHIESSRDFDWFGIHQGMSVRVLANLVAKGTADGIK